MPTRKLPKGTRAKKLTATGVMLANPPRKPAAAPVAPPEATRKAATPRKSKVVAAASLAPAGAPVAAPHMTPPAYPAVEWSARSDDEDDAREPPVLQSSIIAPALEINGYTAVTPVESEEYPDLAAGLLADPFVQFEIGGQTRMSAALAVAQGYANSLQEPVRLIDAAGDVVMSFQPEPPRGFAFAKRGRSATRDWTVKPVVAAAANLGVNALLDRIDAARGDVDALRAFIGKFVGSSGSERDLDAASTYYRWAGKFLWALIKQAEGAKAAETLVDTPDLQSA